MDQQLLAYVTVVEKNSFTRAAEALHLTQSAITLTIKSLEKKYGVKLLDRTNKYVRLTKAGEIVYYHAKEILSNYDQMKRLVDELSNNASGTLNIGASYTFGEYILPKLIAKFYKLYPKIEPDIAISNSTSVISQLIQGELDLGIIEGEMQHSQLNIIPFAEDEMMLIVAKDHPLAVTSEVNIEDLADQTWIIREAGSGTRQALDRLFEANDFSPKQTRIFGSSQIIKESVEAGLGIALLSKWVIRKEMELGTIKAVRINGHSIIRKFSYALRKTEYQPKTTHLFLDFIVGNPYLLS